MQWSYLFWVIRYTDALFFFYSMTVTLPHDSRRCHFSSSFRYIDQRFVKTASDWSSDTIYHSWLRWSSCVINAISRVVVNSQTLWTEHRQRSVADGDYCKLLSLLFMAVRAADCTICHVSLRQNM